MVGKKVKQCGSLLLSGINKHDTVVDEDVDEQPVQDLALNVDNIFQTDDCDAFDYDVDEAPTDAVCEHHEVHEMHDDVQLNCIVDSDAEYTSDSNMISYDQYVKDNAESVVQTLVKEIKEMQEVFEQIEAEVDQHAIDKKCDEIKQKNLIIKNENLIVDWLSKDVFYTTTDFVLNVSRFSNMHEEFNAAQKRITKLESENSNLKNKIRNDDHDASINENHKSNCITMLVVKSKVLALGTYVIDVEPIPPRFKKNREVHLDYLKHLKESVATLREIVEEARVEKPLDSSLASACLYTKHSHELVEYVTGTCLNNFNKGDKQIASIHVTRKKRVTSMDPCETSTNNTLTHVKQQTMNNTNEHVIPFTGVKGATAASGSKPMRNTKKDRTFPAKIDMKK
nr:hypothetical protein [Tanacetum cinerariifolium]